MAGNLNNSWFHTLLEDIIFLNGYFKTQNLASLLLAFFSVGFSMHKKGAESSFLCPALFSGEFTMSETWADTTLPTLPFNALIAQCFGTVRAPSPVVIITVTWKRSAASDWHSKWPFCQRGDTDRAAQADTHLKPSQFNEAQHVDSNKSCLPLCSYRTVSKPCWMRLFSRRSGRWSR